MKVLYKSETYIVGHRACNYDIAQSATDVEDLRVRKFCGRAMEEGLGTTYTIYYHCPPVPVIGERGELGTKYASCNSSS